MDISIQHIQWAMQSYPITYYITTIDCCNGQVLYIEIRAYPQTVINKQLGIVIQDKVARHPEGVVYRK